jgi:7,8-dihydroneopterin aldolase/epimerase/oxygenase
LGIGNEFAFIVVIIFFLIMLTVSLHGIKIHALIGLYPEEKISGNDFEVDVDIWLPEALPWPFADYSVVFATVNEVFGRPAELLETLVYDIYLAWREQNPIAEKVRVGVRKMNPPLGGTVAYSQVCFEA